MEGLNKEKIQNNHLPLVWIDLEMTGLDDKKDLVLEICIIITDTLLKPLPLPESLKNADHVYFNSDGIPYFHLVVHYDDAILEQLMPLYKDKKTGEYLDWCRRTHTQTGLIDRIRQSTVPMKVASNLSFQYVKSFMPDKFEQIGPILCGSSIHADRRFIKAHMQELDQYLHYRMIDVSSVKELCKFWNQSVYKKLPAKLNTHKAVDDILESLQELQFYKDHFLKMELN